MRRKKLLKPLKIKPLKRKLKMRKKPKRMSISN